jgi:stearoyl-CoA desaturase (delta-9 desaturase)
METEQMNARQKPYDWTNILFLTLSPIVAFGSIAWYSMNHGVHPVDVGLFLGFYLLTGIGITGGYHRLYSHKSYDCKPALEILYLLFSAAALQNSALRWSRDHRIHHQKTDKDEDPYSVMRGAFHAHMGWIFYKNPERDDNFALVPDLLKNPRVMWQERHYLPIALGIGFLLPVAIGFAFGRPLGGFLWGGLLRVVFVHHATFCINSVAHLVGTRPYSLANTARDSWWLSLFTYGEGYHNYHHRFPTDYRNGIRWYHWDLTKWWINTMQAFGLVSGKKRIREELILRARIETDLERVRLSLARAPESLAARMESRLDAARVQLEAAARRCHKARRRILALRRSAFRKYGIRFGILRLKVRQYDLQYQLAHVRWALIIAAASRAAGSGPVS